MPPPPASAQALAAAFTAGAVTAAGVMLLLRARRGTRAVHVRRPHPGWSPPAKQAPPYDANTPMHVIDPSTTSAAELYPLVISAVVPRPIGFVGSLSKDGVANLAPYR
jgi:hypothetical protein